MMNRKAFTRRMHHDSSRVSPRANGKLPLSVLKTLIDHISHPAFIKDRKHRYVALNRTFSKLLGHRRDNILGKSDYCFFSKGQADAARKIEEEMCRAGRIIDIPEESFTDKRGRLHWIHRSITPLTDSSGRIVHLLGIIEDITERKHKERDLILKEQIARHHAQLLNDLRLLGRPDDILTRVCKAIRDSGLFGRAVMTLHDESRHLTHLGQVGLPRKLVELSRKAPPLNRKQIKRMTSERFRISDSFFIPVEAGFDFSKSDRYIPQREGSPTADWKIGDELFIPLRDSAGRIMGYLSADSPRDGCRPDLMKIQSMEMLVEAAASRIREIEIHNSLRQERDYTQTILETANSIIICLDAEAKIREFNHEAERITGYRREEVIGKSWPKMFLPKEYLHPGLKNFARWVKAHPRDQYESVIITKKGEIRTISWSNSAVIGPKETDVIAIAVGQDITARKRTDEALQAASQRLSYLQSVSPAVIYSSQVSPPYPTTFISENIREQMGYEPEQFTEDPGFWASKIHPKDVGNIFTGLKQILLKGHHLHEYRFLHKDGTYRWVYDEMRLIRDGKGNPKEIVGHFVDITERKQKEEVLRESEERFRQLGENIDLVFWLTDWKNKKLLYVNPSYESIFGRSCRSAYENRLDWYNLIHPDDRSRVRNLLARNAQLGKNTEVEYRIFRDDGTLRYILDRNYPIRDKHGRVHRIVSVAADITDRKQMEQVLRESEEKYKTLVENASDQIFMIDRSYRLVSANRAVVDLFGKKIHQIVGKSISRIFPKEIAQRNINNIRQVFETRKPILLEEKMIVGGHEFWSSTSLNPVRDFAGKVIAVMGVVRDISERKRLEEEKHQTETKYRMVVNHANEGIIIAQGRFLKFVNPKMAEIVGYSEEELLSRPFAGHFHPDDRKKVLTRYSQRIKGEKVPSVYEFRIIDRKGHVKWLEMNAVRILWEGKPATLNFLTDITERKEAERYRDQYREQKTLYELMRSLSAASSMEALLDIAAQRTTELLGIERSTIVLLNEDGKSATLKAIHQKGKSIGPRSLGYVFTADIFPQLTKILVRRPIVFEDVSSLPKKNWIRSFFEDRGIRSTLSVPLISRAKLIGVLAVSTTDKPHRYTAAEIRLLQTIANPIAASIDNITLLDNIRKQSIDLKKQTEQKDVLLNISRELSKAKSIAEIVEAGIKAIVTNVGADRCAFLLTSVNRDYLELKGIYSEGLMDTRKIAGIRYPIYGDIYLKKLEEGKIPYILFDKSNLSSISSQAREVWLKQNIAFTMMCGLYSGTKLIGALAVSNFREEKRFNTNEIALIQSICSQLALAIENTQLLEVITRHTGELKDLTAELMQTQEKEQDKLAKELHDQVGQMLQAMKMNLDRIRRDIPDNPKMEFARDRLIDTSKLLAETIEEIRSLSFALRPATLDDFGLAKTLKWYVNDYSRRSGIQVLTRFKDETFRCPADVETNLFRVTQEALNNVIKHAGATEVVISFYKKEGTALLSVADNGKGFDREKTASYSHTSTGILNMKERVDLLGGKLQIISRPGKGTRINITVPLPIS